MIFNYLKVHLFFYWSFLLLLQIPIEDIIEEEKSSRKSPPENDKEKNRERDVSLSMAPLPIPLGPLGGLSGNEHSTLFFVQI